MQGVPKVVFHFKNCKLYIAELKARQSYWAVNHSGFMCNFFCFYILTFFFSCLVFSQKNKTYKTERGGSVVTHETRIREVPGSNPGADLPDWGFFMVFLSHQGKCWVGFSLPQSIWPLFIKFIYHRIKISELNKWNIDNTTIEIHSLLVHTQKTLDAIWPKMFKRL